MFALFDSIWNERWALPCLSSCVFLLNLLFYWILSNSEWANLECTHNVRTHTLTQLKWWDWKNNELRRESLRKREREKKYTNKNWKSQQENEFSWESAHFQCYFPSRFCFETVFSRLFLLRFVLLLLLLLLAVHPFEIKWTHLLRRIHTSHQFSQPGSLAFDMN